jgi:hypothetical protein
MAVVTLTILSPSHGAVLGPDPQVFEARIDAGAPPSAVLHFRWYSSLPNAPGGPPPLVRPPDLDKVALAPQSTARECTASLLVGSQAITLAVKDAPGDAEADLKTVRHAGSTGGDPKAPSPCVVHVLVADSRVPAPSTAATPVTANRAAGLWAQAPPSWPDPAYQALNRLVYRWSFRPASGPPVDVPPATPLEFRDRKDAEPPQVGLPAIPATVPDGAYDLTLTVAYVPAPADPPPPPNPVLTRSRTFAVQVIT